MGLNGRKAVLKKHGLRVSIFADGMNQPAPFIRGYKQLAEH